VVSEWPGRWFQSLRPYAAIAVGLLAVGSIPVVAYASLIWAGSRALEGSVAFAPDELFGASVIVAIVLGGTAWEVWPHTRRRSWRRGLSAGVVLVGGGVLIWIATRSALISLERDGVVVPVAAAVAVLSLIGVLGCVAAVFDFHRERAGG
jgi:hypothetical protein